MNSYLKYYKKIKGIPVVDIKDISEKKLIQLRFNFYYKLGITPGDLANKKILELCPGTGYNAFYLLNHCKIKNLTLVEKNYYSIKFLKKNLSSFENIKILNKDVNLFKTKEKYDYVIIENALAGLHNPKKIFKNCLKFLNDGGILIVTLNDLFGIFAEKLKYLYSWMLLRKYKINSYNKQLSFLKNIFKKDLKYLSKNTRKADKWVADVILNPAWIKKNNYFCHNDIKQFLKNKYLIKSMSPSFKDYEWYKEMTIESHNLNIFKNLPFENLNFLDYKENIDKKSNKINIYIKKFTKLISTVSLNKNLDTKKLLEFRNIIYKISQELNKLKFNNKISLTLNEFLILIDKFLKKNKIQLRTKYLYKLWGKGSHHLSLYKIPKKFSY
jgi:SAM-dependent methyltransferase